MSSRGELPTPVLFLIALASFLLVGFLLMWAGFKGTAKYQQSQATDYSGYPGQAASSPSEASYEQKLQEVHSQELQLRQQAGKEYERTTQETQDQYQRLQMQRDRMKSGGTPF
jgi:hypothetical protein